MDLWAGRRATELISVARQGGVIAYLDDFQLLSWFWISEMTLSTPASCSLLRYVFKPALGSARPMISGYPYCCWAFCTWASSVLTLVGSNANPSAFDGMAVWLSLRDSGHAPTVSSEE